MVDVTLLSALSFALIAGVATFFSPCAYALLPGYVGFYVDRIDGERASVGGALARGLVAGAGVLLTLGLIMVVGVRVGESALAGVERAEPFVGVALVAFGLLVVFDRMPSLSVSLPRRRSSVRGFGIFGAGYAIAAAGCVSPIVAGVVFRASELSGGEAVLVTGTYVASVVVLMVAITVATGVGLLAGAGRLAAHARTFQLVAGLIMILAGIGQLFVALGFWIV